MKRRFWFYLTDAGIASMWRWAIVHPVLGPILRVAVVCSILIVLLGIIMVIREPFSPSDWVEITVKNLPQDNPHVYLISEDLNGIRPMRWYHSKVFAFVDNSPELYEEWHWGINGFEKVGNLQWPNADRYGALIQRNNGQWLICWFKPEDFDRPSVTRYFLGNGVAEVRLPDLRGAEPAPAELLKKFPSLYSK